MSTIDIRHELHHFVDNIDDERATELYIQFEAEMQNDRKKLIQEERNRYLAGEGKSYSWEDVKKMARDKQLRDGLSN